MRLILPAIHPTLNRACHIVSGMHPGEVDVRGRAPKRHPARVLFRTECEKPRLARLHRDSVAQVRMWLDSAGHYQLASRVDHLGGLDSLGSESGSAVSAIRHLRRSCDSSRSAKQSTTFAFSAEKSEILLVFAILSALREPENLSWKLTHRLNVRRAAVRPTIAMPISLEWFRDSAVLAGCAGAQRSEPGFHLPPARPRQIHVPRTDLASY